MQLWRVAVLGLALFAASEAKKKHHHHHDGEFENFAEAVPVGAQSGFNHPKALPILANQKGVQLAPIEADAPVDYDPRLADPPCLWTAWSACDAACGGGSAFRMRRLTEECAYGPAQQLKVCNAQPCPQDCLLGEWSAWGCGEGCGGCSAPCGGGQRSRQRPVLTPALFGGECAAEVVQTEACNNHECPLDCVAVTEWNEWAECSLACGGGRRERRRQTQLVVSVRPGRSQTEAECPESLQEENCNSQGCPIDCVLDELTGWSQWSRCSATCGDEGTQVREREILQHPQNSGNDCPPVLEIRQCEEELPGCPQANPVDPWPVMAGDPIILPPLPKALPPVIQSEPEEEELSIPEGFCDERADGPYEHPDCLCCNDLIMCFQRSPILKWCPPGEVFVGQWSKCVKRPEAPNC